MEKIYNSLPLSGRTPEMCEICFKLEYKYKCPTCLKKYCGVECFEKHYKTGCQREDLITIQECKKEEATSSQKEEYVSETEDTVPLEKLRLLACDQELRNQLANAHLKDILLLLDTSSNPEKSIDDAMKEPIFTEFANSCLRLVESEGANQT
ncbi:zinc finger HIT domain-containing protein 3 isoform X2 [Tachypleus tridentatus]|uniref:zinc finger HIT domain-containing protein 3 isoform X2 n=1 Tax=Tachypleus tridentatus TaxID=6853 RepID=UPI003FD4ED13